MNEFERHVRASVYASFRDQSRPPSAAELSDTLRASPGEVSSALRNLAEEHCLVLVPGTESIWMAHPFSGIETDFVVTIGARQVSQGEVRGLGIVHFLVPARQFWDDIGYT